MVCGCFPGVEYRVDRDGAQRRDGGNPGNELAHVEVAAGEACDQPRLRLQTVSQDGLLHQVVKKLSREGLVDLFAVGQEFRKISDAMEVPSFTGRQHVRARGVDRLVVLDFAVTPDRVEVL